MADLTVTAANVLAGTNAVKKTVRAAAAITAGQLLYKASDGRYGVVDADSATAEARVPAGIALNNAGANQPVIMQTAGDITIGATLTVGAIYVASDNAGGIMPVADLETGDYVTIIGVAISASVLRLAITSSGVAVP